MTYIDETELLAEDHLSVKDPTTLIRTLKNAEGLRRAPYRDTRGHVTIGYGRNLDAEGISDDEAYMLLVNDVDRCIDEAREIFDNFDQMNCSVQNTIIELIFNLGASGFRSFKHTISYIKAGARVSAASELLNSKAAKQLPERYARLAEQLRGSDK